MLPMPRVSCLWLCLATSQPTNQSIDPISSVVLLHAFIFLFEDNREIEAENPTYIHVRGTVQAK